MKFIRRWWGFGLVGALIVTHAVVIGYVRSRVAQLQTTTSNTVSLGQFQFQPSDHPETIYQFTLHAMLDPGSIQRGSRQIEGKRTVIREKVGQVMRQIDPQWFADPMHQQIRSRLTEVVIEHLDSPLVERMLITDWLRIPTTLASTSMP